MRPSTTVGLLLGLTLCARSASAQEESATQWFIVHVPPQASVSAPPAAELTHDGNESPQQFPPQTWSASGSVRSGLSVTFRADPFTHTADSALQRDARLDIGVATSTGPAVQDTRPISGI